jgi:predicted pyridoxine 5'-phosphate oxidase superfamily flavin-nucleotide-binding protein
MTHRFADITFTDSVKAAQQHYGSRSNNDRVQNLAGPNDQLGSKEAAFIALRDTFYMATVNEEGWPYVQHRGGPAGFLKVLGPNQLVYADFRGNTQLISVGNASKNDRCSLILMDYPNRRRLKILGHMSVEDASQVGADAVSDVSHPEYKAKIERVVLIDVVAFDWNCPQHITRRYTESEYSDKQLKV